MLRFTDCVKEKKLAGNTYLVRIDDATWGVRFHDTIILRIHADGSYTLNSGGYRTATTKERLNRFGPATVYQHKHEWYANGVPFVDGMKVTA